MRNLAFLVTGSFLGTWGQMVIAVVGGIVGAELAPDRALATLPITTALLGTAAATIPAAMLMKRIGRQRGFQIASLGAFLAALLACTAIVQGSFWAFCGATSLLGAYMAFNAQIRFAAAECVPPARASFAISAVMVGTLLSAIVAPRLLVAVSGRWFDATHAAIFVVISLAYLGVAAALIGYREVPVHEDHAEDAPRPFAELLRQPLLWAALLSALTGFAIMNLVMTATPVSMHVVDGHSLPDTAFVIQSHALAMFSPALISGWLVAKLGTRTMIFAGLIFEAACVIIAISGKDVGHYWSALVLLGIGWNFLFVAGSTLLTRTYRPSERFRVQALNDFAIFGAMAAASVMAGAALAGSSWEALNLGAGLALVIAAIVITTLLKRAEVTGGAD